MLEMHTNKLMEIDIIRVMAMMLILIHHNPDFLLLN